MNADALDEALKKIKEVAQKIEFDYTKLARILSDIANEIDNSNTQEELDNFVMELDHTLDGGYWR